MHAALLLSLAAFVGAIPEQQLSGRDFLRLVVATGGELVIQREEQLSEFIDDDADLPRETPFSIIRVDAVESALDDLRQVVSLPPFDELDVNARQLNSTNARALRALRRLPCLVIQGTEGELVAIDRGPPIQGLEVAWVFSATIGSGVVSLLANTQTQREILFDRCRFEAGVLAELKGARALRRLDVSGATDADLADLPPLPSLQTLVAADGGKIGPGLAALSRQPALEELNLGSREIDIKHLHHLGRIARLQRLYLDKTNISDDAASVLATLHGIRALSLEATQITDGGVRALANLPRLEELTLDETPISDASVRILKTFPALRSLDLFWSGIHVESLESMQDFKTLERLNVLLTTGEFGDERAAVLARIPRLKDLSLGPARLTPAGIRSLGAVGTLESLRLFHQPIDASVVGELAKLVGLKHLTLCLPGTDDGEALLEFLQSRLPKCSVAVL